MHGPDSPLINEINSIRTIRYVRWFRVQDLIVNGPTVPPFPTTRPVVRRGYQTFLMWRQRASSRMKINFTIVTIRRGD